MPGYFPTPYPVCHLQREIDTGEIDPDTGNPKQVTPPPVIRYIQAIAQYGHHGSSHQEISAEFVKRIETELIIAVPDPTVYAAQDQVLLFPELDENGDYIPDTGIAFWVDGLFNDQRLAPWASYFRVFGGSIKLRRIT